MYKLLSLTVLAVLLSLPAGQAQLTSYCGMPSCHGRTHIACTPQDNWGATCALRYGYNMLNLRDVQQPMLDLHNTYRNQVAGGGLTGFPTAAMMGTCQWNVTLANLARINTRQCESKFDQCRNTPDLIYVGQNIGWATYDITTDKRTNAEVLLDIIDWWFTQCPYGVDAVDAYQPTTGEKRWNSCAQMLRDVSSRVGCAAVAFFWDSKLTIRTILVTCNYDVGVMQNQPVYLAGTPTSGCATGKNPTLSNLCSINEIYNQNDPLANYE